MLKLSRETLLRVAILFAGLVIAHLGVTLFILAELGNDPFNVFIQGLLRTLEKVVTHPLLTQGNVHLCISILIVLVLLWVDRSYVRIGTLVCMAAGGPIIDVFSRLLKPLFEAVPGLGFRLAMLAAGCVILAFGMTLVIKSQAGTGPNDLVAVVISDKLKKRFSIIRILVDFCFVAVGFVLGATVDVGTLVCAFLVGPVAGFFLPRSERIADGILKKLL